MCICHFHTPDQQGVKHCAIKSSVYAQAGPLQAMNTIAINTEDRLHVFSHLQSSVNEFWQYPGKVPRSTQAREKETVAYGLLYMYISLSK